MSASDYILIMITWTHNLGAVVWVGGCLFYYLVLRPVFTDNLVEQSNKNLIADQFRHVIKTTIWILILTGIVLAVSHVAIQTVPIMYVYVLAIKVCLAIMMFVLYLFNKGTQKLMFELFGVRVYKTDMILILGVLVIGLSDILSALAK